MKKMLVTAAALMLGTSALAWAPAEKAHMDATGMEAAQSDWAKSAWSAEKSPLAFSLENETVMKAESIGLASSASTIKSETDVPAMFAKWEDPSVEPAASASVDMADVKGAVQMASVDEKSVVQTASWDGKADGATGEQIAMGGPIEEPQGYAACAPGRGDDHCIQLYERGVEGALAAWKGSEPEVAVGGPFEPAATGAKDHSSADHQSMDHGQSGPDTGSPTGYAGKPAAAPMPMSSDEGAAKPAEPVADTAPGASGGPIEPMSAYPPCRPGRGDDRCIQLYERGVARRDN